MGSVFSTSDQGKECTLMYYASHFITVHPYRPFILLNQENMKSYEQEDYCETRIHHFFTENYLKSIEHEVCLNKNVFF